MNADTIYQAILALVIFTGTIFFMLLSIDKLWKWVEGKIKPDSSGEPLTWREWLKIVGSFLLMAAVIGLVLAVTWFLTAPPIATWWVASREEATPTIIPTPLRSERQLQEIFLIIATQPPPATATPPLITVTPFPVTVVTPTLVPMSGNTCIRPTPSRASAIIGQHEVQSGETIYCIARAYGVAPQAVIQANGLQRSRVIHRGLLLNIPDAPWSPIPTGKVCLPQFTSPYSEAVCSTSSD
jgi:LysM repeat protein